MELIRLSTASANKGAYYLPQDVPPARPAVRLLTVSGRVPGMQAEAAIIGDTPSAVPFGRWDVDHFALLSPNKLEPRFSSFLPGVELFDGRVFRINRYPPRLKPASTWSLLFDGRHSLTSPWLLQVGGPLYGSPAQAAA